MKLVFILFVVALTSTAQQRNPHQGSRDAVETGRGMFRIYCSPCHGIGAKGGRAPDLTLGSYSVGSSDEALFRLISAGAQGTEMPGFSERFDTDGIWRLVTYIRSVAGTPPPSLKGDAGAGEKIFRGKGGCGACHRVNGRGGRMGPDLSLAGRQRSLTYIKESILEPNAALSPGYNTVTVLTRDGKKVVGVQKGYDGFSAQLMDASENYHSFFRDEVKEMTREFRSLMPSTYGRLLSPSELNDLLVYMTSLRGVQTR